MAKPDYKTYLQKARACSLVKKSPELYRVLTKEEYNGLACSFSGTTPLYSIRSKEFLSDITEENKKFLEKLKKINWQKFWRSFSSELDRKLRSAEKARASSLADSQSHALT